MLDNKEDILKLFSYFVASIVAISIRLLRNPKRNFNIFITELLLGASFAFFIIPAAVEKFEWSVYMGCGATWVVTMFSEIVLKQIEKRIGKKDNHDRDLNNY